MSTHYQYQIIGSPYCVSEGTIRNYEPAPQEEAPVLHILWMYPSTLSLHGGRGDIMALLRFATLAKRPVDIRRIENLNDPVPLEEADMLYFCAGDLACMPDVIRALEPIREALRDFSAQGKVIVANGSTGAILARDLTLEDGTVVPGLGLLDMHWKQRTSVHGDDLWMKTADGLEIIGDEIKLADVTLDPGQAPFGTVTYGKGNCGDGFEGAITGNVICTGCLGPVLVRNPALAMNLLERAAGAPLPALAPSDIPYELAGLAETKAFIQKKMKK